MGFLHGLSVLRQYLKLLFGHQSERVVRSLYIFSSKCLSAHPPTCRDFSVISLPLLRILVVSSLLRDTYPPPSSKHPYSARRSKKTSWQALSQQPGRRNLAVVCSSYFLWRVARVLMKFRTPKGVTRRGSGDRCPVLQVLYTYPCRATPKADSVKSSSPFSDCSAIDFFAQGLLSLS